LTTQTKITRGVRAVAVFEALKGTLVFVVGFGLLALIHRDAQGIAERLVQHLHLNPARHYPRIFIEAAGHFNDTSLRSLAALACVYGVVRYVEAYGLWRKKVWAEWFAIISGSIYLPIEAYEIFERVTWMRVIVLLVNAFIVGYLVYVRLLNRQRAVTHEGKEHHHKNRTT
jgi:uncharacterized membrane protein (DUF2068 family)